MVDENNDDDRFEQIDKLIKIYDGSVCVSHSKFLETHRSTCASSQGGDNDGRRAIMEEFSQRSLRATRRIVANTNERGALISACNDVMSRINKVMNTASASQILHEHLACHLNVSQI